jgi:hypothetical protein
VLRLPRVVAAAGLFRSFMSVVKEEQAGSGEVAHRSITNPHFVSSLWTGWTGTPAKRYAALQTHKNATGIFMRSIVAITIVFWVLAAARPALGVSSAKCGSGLTSAEQQVVAAEVAKLDAREVTLRRSVLKKARLDSLICSDDELSDLHGEMNEAYWAAMKRSGRYNTAALRYDQREFEEGAWDEADRLMADAAEGNEEGRKGAAKDLRERLRDRIKVLKAFEPERRDFEGEWRSETGRVEITKEGSGYKVSVAMGVADGVRRGCQGEGSARIEDGGMIAETKAANSKPRRMRLRLKGGGLTGEILEAGDGDACIRGDDFDKALYFIPVRRGLEEAGEKKAEGRTKRADRERGRRRQSQGISGPGALLRSILPGGR